MNYRLQLCFNIFPFLKGEKKRTMIRRILLILHNCWLNGMANIYLHNNLEIFSKTHHGHGKNERKKSLFEEDSEADNFGILHDSNPEADDTPSQFETISTERNSMTKINPSVSSMMARIGSIEEENEDVVFQEEVEEEKNKPEVEEEKNKPEVENVTTANSEVKPAESNSKTKTESSPNKDYR